MLLMRKRRSMSQGLWREAEYRIKGRSGGKVAQHLFKIKGALRSIDLKIWSSNIKVSALGT